MQANKKIFDSPCGVIDFRLPERHVVALFSVCLNIAASFFVPELVNNALNSKLINST